MARFALNRIGQIALAVRDVDRAEAFYRDVLGLRHLYRYGDLTFFDCAGVRLLLKKRTIPTVRTTARRSISSATTSPWRYANWNSAASSSMVRRI